MVRNVSRKSVLHTDESKLYIKIGKEYAGHETVHHAAKEYVRFIFEKEQYEPWQKASIGYWSHPLAAYSGNPIWTEDPKHEAYAEVMKDPEFLKEIEKTGMVVRAQAGETLDGLVRQVTTAPRSVLDRTAQILKWK